MNKQKQLRDKILSLLGEYLGTYQLSNGEIIPAIQIVESGDGNSNDRKVSGLEIVVAESVGIEYVIFLKKWAGDPAIDLGVIYQILMNEFAVSPKDVTVVDNQNITEQKDLRSFIKIVLNSQKTFTFEDHFEIQAD